MSSAAPPKPGDARDLEAAPAARRRAWPRPNAMAQGGIAVVSICMLVALLGPLFAPHSASEILSPAAFAPPGDGRLLGTDYLGRDLLSRMLFGARLTLGIAFAATLIGFVAGVLVGFVAAESSGWVDSAICRVLDIMISFPPILLALVVITGFGTSLSILIGTIAVIHSARVARIARAIAMNVAAFEFVEVARARGENMLSVIRHDIWPNTIRPLAVDFGLRLTFSVLFLSALSFLGLGVQPPAADWGLLVRENLSGLYYGALAALLPAAAIGALAVGVNLVVDWLASLSGREISSELLK